jgi:hypothetical protein
VIKLASDFGRCVSLDTLVAYIKLTDCLNITDILLTATLSSDSLDQSTRTIMRGQKGKQRSTKHYTENTKDRVTRTSLKKPERADSGGPVG